MLETFKEKGCNFVETSENLYFKSYVIYKQLHLKNEVKLVYIFYFFFSLFNVSTYFMTFILSNLRMNNISNDIVSIIKQLVDVDDVLLSFIALNTMLFINSDLNKQAQVLEVKISRTEKPCHSQACFNNKNLTE